MHLCSGTGGSIGQHRFICQVLCAGIQGIFALVPGRGSISQSRFICQVLCTGIQGISALVLGGPLANIGSSVKFCVLVFKASLLWYQGGGPSAKVGSSAKFCVLVFKASLLWYQGGPLANIGSSVKFCVLVFNLCSVTWVVHWPMKVHLPSFVYWYSRHLCSGTGGALAKEGSSAKFCVLVFKTSLLWYWGVHQPKKVHLPNLSSLAVLCFASQKVFLYHLQKT